MKDRIITADLLNFCIEKLLIINEKNTNFYNA